MSGAPPDRAKLFRVWILLVLALSTWVIHQFLPTMGAGLGPVSGSAFSALVALGCGLYLFIHRRGGRGSGRS